jgi:hypothetical protein
MLTEGSIDDRTVETYIYATYALMRPAFLSRGETVSDPEDDNLPMDVVKMSALGYMATYLNRSFWDDAAAFPRFRFDSDKLRVVRTQVDGALWDMRGRLGRESMDRIVAYAARAVTLRRAVDC